MTGKPAPQQHGPTEVLSLREQALDFYYENKSESRQERKIFNNKIHFGRGTESDVLAYAEKSPCLGSVSVLSVQGLNRRRYFHRWRDRLCQFSKTKWKFKKRKTLCDFLVHSDGTLRWKKESLAR